MRVRCAGDARSHTRQEFSSLEAWLFAPSMLKLPLHQIERQQQTKGRGVQRLLLQAHLQRRGHGDMGPALCVRQGDDKVLGTHRRLSTRSLKTVFGTIEIVRMGYSHAGANSIYPLNAGWLCLRVCSLTSCKDVGPGSDAGYLPGIH